PRKAAHWGRLVTSRPGTQCEVTGFPAVVGTPEVRDTEQARGTINPGALVKSGMLAIGIDHPPSRTTATESPWAGMSGAAVWCEGLLTGVVVIDPAGYDSRRLVATPSSAFVTNQAFLALVL